MAMMIAAIGFDSLFAIGFVLITVIGWIMNLINAQNPPPQPKQPAERPRPRDRKVQTEIEEFLQQAMSRRGPQKRAANEGIEILDQPPQRKPPVPRAEARPASVAPPAPELSAAPLPRPGEAIATRQSVSSLEPGAGVRPLDVNLGERVAPQIRQEIPSAIASSVAQHLGAFRANDRLHTTSVPTSRSRAPILEPGLLSEIRRPRGMRKAIILQEILSKPKALRND